MTEKTQIEKNAAQRQTELLTEALDRAKTNDGMLLNASGRRAPLLYPSLSSVSPFNMLVMNLHSDAEGYSTGLYTMYQDAKKRGESVLEGQKGVPFVWYRWNGYRSREDRDRTITRDEYAGLSDEKKKDYVPIREREIRTLFNIEQTTLPIVDGKTYETLRNEHGRIEDRDHGEKEDKKVRMEFNRFLQNISANLVPVRKDGIGIAHYDMERDVIHLPAQKNYDSYEEYVQEAMRQIVAATGHRQRLGRPDAGEAAMQRERLVVEMTSAVRMSQMGLPARLAPESMVLVDGWKDALLSNDRMLYGLEADINNAVTMMLKAERGEKIEKGEAVQQASEPAETINANVVMLKDDNGKWMMYLKPESESGFAVYPDKSDLGRFFSTSRQGDEKKTEEMRQKLAQKYYSLAAADPKKKIDPFRTADKSIDLSRIQRVNIIRTRDDESRILCYPTIKDMGRVEPRELTAAQWQLLWIAEDRDEYKRNLAATLYADILKEQKEKDVQEEKQQEVQSRGIHR